MNTNYSHHKSALGVTLFEMLIVIALITGFALLLTPLTEVFFTKNRVQSRVDTIKQAIHYAKNQAILMDERLVLAEIAEDNWTKGMRLFVDHNDNHSFDEDDKLLRVWRFEGAIPTIEWRGFVSNHYLLFSPEIEKSALSGRFIISGKTEKKEIIINRLGRIRLAP